MLRYLQETGLVQEKLDRADTDHDRAESDHTIATSDHTAATADHAQASADHTQAGTDHGTAAADHTTATSDHTQAGQDHTLAAADHVTAGEDHAQALDDHQVMAGYDTRLTNAETEISQLRQEADDLVEVTGLIPGTQNLFDAATAVNCKLINSAGSVALSNNAQSYIVPVSPGKLVTVDHKTTGNRFAIWSFAKYPAVGDVPIQTVSNNSASSLNITLGSTEKYILIYVNTSSSSTVNVDNLRVYYGTQFIEKTSTALWYEQNIPSIPLKIFDSITDTSIQGFVTAGGGVSQSSNYKRSDYLAVRPNHKYKLTINGFICAYDQNKQVISNSGYQGDGALIDVDYTTPANCAYVIVSARCDGEYVENSGFFKFYDLAPDYRIADSFLRWKPMNGKKIVVFGDSIAGNYRAGWPLMLQEKTGALVYNCGFGGCRMELLDGQDAAGTNPFAMCALVDSIISGDWSTQEASPLYSNATIKASLDLLETIDFSEIDIVLIAYGTNELGYPQDDTNNPKSKYTYAGATRYSLDTLMTQYKQLGVMLLTPIYRYSFGTQTAEDSDKTSGTVSLKIVRVLHSDYDQMEEVKRKKLYDTVQHVVRKCAHFTEYMALGFMIRLCLESWFGHRMRQYRILALISLGAGAGYACTDEAHQLLIDGRSGQWTDVLVDSSGVLIGVTLGTILIKSLNRKNQTAA